MKIVLSIAGSDSSGGAGIQADIKSGFYHKVFMTTAITAVTSQNTLGVSDVVVLEPNFVIKQIELKSQILKPQQSLKLLQLSLMVFLK